MKQKVLSLVISFALIIGIIPFMSVASDALSTDTTAPTISSVKFDKTTVKPGETLKITVTPEDESGIKSIELAFVNGDYIITNSKVPFHDNGDGTWSATVTPSSDWPSGTYKTTHFYVRDIIGNYEAIYTNYAYSFKLTNSKTQDNHAPTISSVKFDKTTVKPRETLKITVTPEDESGIKSIELAFVNGNYIITNSKVPFHDNGDGTWSATVTPSSDWPSGTYKTTHFYVRDIIGNYEAIYTNHAYSFKLEETKDDHEAPTISSVKFDKTTVKPGETLKITVTPEDESGIKSIELAFVNGDYIITNSKVPFHDNGDGTWSATVTPSSDWPSGTYKTTHFYVRDIVGNYEAIYTNYAYSFILLDAPSESPKPSETVKPSESPKPSETVKPSDSPKPSETVKPSESPKPSETVKPSDSPKPSETVKPSESPKPSETVKPSDSPKPSETVKPSESPKPSETIKPSESPKPSETVTPDQHSDNCPSKHYSDMQNTEGKWFHEGVDYAITQGYMTGVENNQFAPNRAVSRAMVAQILYAAEGKPTVSKSAGFSDVKAGKWYAIAVNWAASRGVVAGYPDGSFKPDKAVTREELVTILYKYAQTKTDAFGIAIDALEKFQDKNQIHPYAVNAMEWAVSSKIISGTNEGLEPRGTATRAQLAVILQAFDNSIKK